MERVVVLGRGGAGKSTAAVRLGQITGLPVIELDILFWQADLSSTAPRQWAQVQQDLAASDRWIMDGDLGRYDILAGRLIRADTVLILDFSLARCTWRAARRSRERAEFWWWLLTWRRRSLPGLLHAVAAHAPTANLHLFRTPRELRRFLSPEPLRHSAHGPARPPANYRHAPGGRVGWFRGVRPRRRGSGRARPSA